MTRLTVERLGHRGDGIAPGPVYVPRALPGEVVDGLVEGGRMREPRIVTPSPQRVRAPCPHYKRCGGCSLQHVADDAVAQWKASVVEDSLATRGISAKVRRIHTSPAHSRRRATLTGRRMKSGAVVGFHAPESVQVHPIPDCHVLTPALVACIPALERLTVLAGSRKGEMRFAVTETDGGIDVKVIGGKPLTLALREEISALVVAHALARVTWEDEPVIVRAQPSVDLGGVRVKAPPGAFLQATYEGQAALQACVREALEGARGPVVDLFSGAGTFTLSLARTAEVHAVEAASDLLAALEGAWRHASGLRKVSVEERDLFRRPLLAEEVSRFSGVVIDPPRAGAERQMTEIARSTVSRVASVSCDPVTFARDAALLVEGGFRLVSLDVIDQFRWSSHIETVGYFLR